MTDEVEWIAAGLSIMPPIFNEDGDANYAIPNGSGLHVCGCAIAPDDSESFEQAYTAALVLLPEDSARACFDAAKAIGECERNEQDFVFDLVIDGDVVDDMSKTELAARVEARANKINPTGKLRRGRVWCTECGHTQRVVNGITNGWPKCCGYTMTIDSPEERAALRAQDAE